MANNEAADLLPRNSYFHAVDRQMETDSFPSKIIPTEQGRRHKLLTIAIQDAENLIGALKTAKQFDRLGNIEHALPQITDALADVVAKANNFVADVEVSTGRYRGAVATSSTEAAGGQPAETAAAVDGPDASAAAASTPEREGDNIAHFEWSDPTSAPMPKPGPHLASVSIFDPNASQKDQLAALDARVAAARWGGDRR